MYTSVCYVICGCGGLKKGDCSKENPWHYLEQGVGSASQRTVEGRKRERAVSECVCVGCLVMEKGVVGVRGAERETDCRYGGGGWGGAKGSG